MWAARNIHPRPGRLIAACARFATVSLPFEGVGVTAAQSLAQPHGGVFRSEGVPWRRTAMKHAFICVSLLICWSNAATAQVTSEQCKNIADELTRLTCYTDVIQQATGPLPAPASSAWQTHERRSGSDKYRDIFISLPAAKTRAHNQRFSTSRALLTIACQSGRLNISVGFVEEVAPRSPMSIRYRVGSHEPVTAEWDASPKKRAYGLWDHEGAAHLVRQLVSSEDFFVEGKEPGSDTATSEAMFRLSGIEEAIKPVRTRCPDL